MAVTISNLSKTYPNGVKALKNVSITIGNYMFGLLGPNGALPSVRKCEEFFKLLMLMGYTSFSDRLPEPCDVENRVLIDT